MPETDLSTLVTSLRQDFPEVSFEKSNESRWSAEEQTVFFNDRSRHCKWSLLHEAGHMIHQHKTYETDISLLKMEVEAWQQAKILGKKHSCSIDQEYIEKCLDSYRDWLHKRSQCPQCKQTGVEQKTGQYRCINCGFSWQVSPERFCRVYRKQTKLPASI